VQETFLMILANCRGVEAGKYVSDVANITQ
jgi:hypothetical protein